jgi:hypothetical protein
MSADLVAFRHVTKFTELLETLVARYGGDAALAKEIRVSAARVGRARKGEGGYSFKVENCLRLAQVSGESASDVLRAAGKADVDDLIQELYGYRRPELPRVQRELLDKWVLVHPKAREHIIAVIDMALRAQEQQQPETTKRKKSA